MTKRQIRNLFTPDTPKEWAYIGSSVGRLGTAMSGFLLFQDDLVWNFAALVLTWIGFEVNGYFKLYQSEHGDNNDKP